ncbi:hypothetical protein [Flammeovirga agarivorans]|uniref:Uncharacterized protein n=1 Tax=Flammeovirga agarivorans TaxID=2726742 RepID=A0A7X8SN28_9BACT|nr:hypothetical protein [Flammeovirga agarivorans]NLR93239.1 hypothetical protein [Flammeovirga agarivorans]
MKIITNLSKLFLGVLLSLMSIISFASSDDVGISSTINTKKVDNPEQLITSLEKAIDTQYILSYSDQEKAIYRSEKNVVIFNTSKEETSIQVLCGSRKPNKEYRSTLEFFGKELE